MSEKLFLKLFVFFAFGGILISNLIYPWDHQHYGYLAQSFTRGSLELPAVSSFDSAQYAGRFYWPLGVMPALLILPFTLIFGFWRYWQPILVIIFAASAFYLVFKIAEKFRFSKIDSIWLAIFFTFATPFLGVILAPTSWHVAHVVAVTFILAAFFEYLNQKRFLLIGLFIGFAFLSRPPTLFTSIFFVLAIYFLEKKLKLKYLIQFISPLVLTGILFLVYNYLRFNNPFEAGYKYQPVDVDGVILSVAGRYFDLGNIAGNFFRMFLQGLIPSALFGKDFFLNPLDSNRGGASIFLTTPLFLLVFKSSWKNKLVPLLWSCSLVILIVVLLSFGTGGLQIGSRIFLDLIVPFFLLFVIALKSRVPFWTKPIIILQVLYIVLLFVPLAKERGLI